jgi:hypothetical protein
MVRRYRTLPRLIRTRGSNYWQIQYSDGQRHRRWNTRTTDRTLAQLILDQMILRASGGSVIATPDAHTMGEAIS